MYLIKTPGFIQSLFPSFTWRVPGDEKRVFLTFDDGPVPEVTPWVLDLLDEYNAKATFFCVGENIEKHPEVFESVVRQGHAVGNHTYNHLSGWATDRLPYFLNIRKCAQLVKSELFRPPYGKLRPSQIQFLQRHYQIVMWDVLSADFDADISGEQCARNVLRSVKPGSIVVFHDSVKSEKNLKHALPVVLERLAGEGYSFESITPELCSGPVGKLVGQLSV